MEGEVRCLEWRERAVTSAGAAAAAVWRPRSRPCTRVTLRLSPELMTRGSHCCLATPELSLVRDRAGAPPCDCVGRGGESYGEFESASRLKMSSSYRRAQREQREAALRQYMREHPPGAYIKLVERFSDGVELPRMAPAAGSAAAGGATGGRAAAAGAARTLEGLLLQCAEREVMHY